MKKLMVIVAALMIAGGVSAHGYCGYHGGGYFHGGYCGPRVVARGYCAPIVAPAPVYYGGGYGYGYRPVVAYHPWAGYRGYYRR